LTSFLILHEIRNDKFYVGL